MFSAFLSISSAFSATLPDGYTELEYLTSIQSKQYIEDTTFQTINTGVIEIKTKSLAYNTRFVGFGDSSKSNVSIALATNWTWMSSYKDVPASYSSWNDVYNNVDYNSSPTFVFRYEFTNGTQKLYINGTLNKTFNQTKGTDTYNFRLFNVTPAASAINGTNTIYYCKVYDGSGNLLREYIPALRNSDNVLGMYDTVTNTFFTNQGTGTFVAGLVVNLPCDYRSLEYIENTFINTGIIPNNSLLSFDVDFQLTDSDFSDAKCVIGAGNYGGDVGGRICFGVFEGYWVNMQPGTNWNKFAPVSYDRKLCNWTIDGSAGTSIISGDLSSSVTSAQHFGYNLPEEKSWRKTNIRIWRIPAKIYNVKIKLDNVLVRDFVPAKRISDNAIGMYDVVSDTFFVDSGTTYIAGPEMVSNNGCQVVNINWGGLEEPDATGMCVYGETFTAPSVTPTAETGYKFLGWRPI